LPDRLITDVPVVVVAGRAGDHCHCDSGPDQGKNNEFQDGIDVVGEAADADGLLDLVATARPDAAFTALPNRTSLTAGLSTTDLPSCGADVPAAQNPLAAAAPTGKIPADKKDVASRWQTWKSQQRFTGPTAKADSANPEQMNHFSWYEAHDWATPYPGETKIYAPDEVPGAYISPADTD
jgi:hypothetical protein